MPLEHDRARMQYHIGLSAAQLNGAQYALLPGDPDRVSSIAEAFTDPADLGQHREFRSMLVWAEDIPVVILSTGIGAPSTAIAVEELAKIGVKNFIRLGTTGAIQESIQLGDLIISEAAVRLEGTSQHYAPLEYPAVASFGLTHALVAAAERRNVPFHCGITCSSDSFWPGQERYDSFTGYVPRRFQGSIAEWQRLGVLNFEMEAAALFTVCRVAGLEAAAVCGVIAQRTQSEVVQTNVYQTARDRLAQVAREAIQIHAGRFEGR